MQRVDTYQDKVTIQPRNRIIIKMKNAEKLPEKIKMEIEIEQELAGIIVTTERDDNGLQKIITNSKRA